MPGIPTWIVRTAQAEGQARKRMKLNKENLQEAKARLGREKEHQDSSTATSSTSQEDRPAPADRLPSSPDRSAGTSASGSNAFSIPRWEQDESVTDIDVGELQNKIDLLTQNLEAAQEAVKKAEDEAEFWRGRAKVLDKRSRDMDRENKKLKKEVKAIKEDVERIQKDNMNRIVGPNPSLLLAISGDECSQEPASNEATLDEAQVAAQNTVSSASSSASSAVVIEINPCDPYSTSFANTVETLVHQHYFTAIEAALELRAKAGLQGEHFSPDCDAPECIATRTLCGIMKTCRDAITNSQVIDVPQLEQDEDIEEWIARSEAEAEFRKEREERTKFLAEKMQELGRALQEKTQENKALTQMVRERRMKKEKMWRAEKRAEREKEKDRERERESKGC